MDKTPNVSRIYNTTLLYPPLRPVAVRQHLPKYKTAIVVHGLPQSLLSAPRKLREIFLRSQTLRGNL